MSRVQFGNKVEPDAVSFLADMVRFDLFWLNRRRVFFVCDVCHEVVVEDAGEDTICFNCKRSFGQDIYKRETQRVNAQIRRTTKLHLLSDLTLAQWILILDKFGWHCAYCGGDFNAMDHMTPVYMGGGTTKNNVVPCCQRCNGHRDVKYQQDLVKV